MTSTIIILRKPFDRLDLLFAVKYDIIKISHIQNHRKLLDYNQISI